MEDGVVVPRPKLPLPRTERYEETVAAPSALVDVAGDMENIGSNLLNVEDAAEMATPPVTLSD